MMEVVVTTGAISRANSTQIVATNKPTPNFLQAGCPTCRPTNSVKALSTQSNISFFKPQMNIMLNRDLLFSGFSEQ